MKKIGILGGSFDPVHSGHISLAQDALVQAGLDKIIFVPAKLQPFKLNKKVTDGKDRLAMLKLATEGIKGFEISEYELDSDSISYTYLTMRAMKEIYGDDTKLYFITGTDSFLKIEEWKNAQELLSNYSFIIGTRPGYKKEELQLCIDKVSRDYNTEVISINNTEIDVSSTELRELLKSGSPVNDLIPEKAERYIKENGLYTE